VQPVKAFPSSLLYFEDFSYSCKVIHFKNDLAADALDSCRVLFCFECCK